MAASGDDHARTARRDVERLFTSASQNTIDGYQRAVADWRTYCELRLARNVESTNHDDAVAFREHLLLEQGYAPTTVRWALSALNSFYRACVEHGEQLANPFSSVKLPPRTAHREHRPLTRRDARALLTTAEDAGARPLALVSLLLLYGHGAAYIGALRPSDVIHDGPRGLPAIRIYMRAQRRAMVPLISPAREAVLTLASGGRDKPLFPAPRAATLNRHQVAEEIKALTRSRPDAMPLPSLLTIYATFVRALLASGAGADDFLAPSFPRARITGPRGGRPATPEIVLKWLRYTSPVR